MLARKGSISGHAKYAGRGGPGRSTSGQWRARKAPRPRTEAVGRRTSAKRTRSRAALAIARARPRRSRVRPSRRAATKLTRAPPFARGTTRCGAKQSRTSFPKTRPRPAKGAPRGTPRARSPSVQPMRAARGPSVSRCRATSAGLRSRIRERSADANRRQAGRVRAPISTAIRTSAASWPFPAPISQISTARGRPAVRHRRYACAATIRPKKGERASG
jgi:hypothetical protein